METNNKCKEDCACKIEGKTHFVNDNCGCPEHNGEEINENNWEEHYPIPNNRIREEFLKEFSQNIGGDSALKVFNIVADWWLSKIDELLKSQPVEHCDEIDCPECNLVAYNKGREDMREEIIWLIEDLAGFPSDVINLEQAEIIKEEIKKL